MQDPRLAIAGWWALPRCAMHLSQAQQAARGGRRSHRPAEIVHNPARMFDKLGIAGGELALPDMNIVFQADPDMTAQKEGLRHHGKGLGAKAEGAPGAGR